MCVDDKRKTLYAAVCEYERGSDAVTEAKRRKNAVEKEDDDDSTERDQETEVLELERALSYNAGVTFWYLAEIERRKVRKFEGGRPTNCICTHTYI